MREAFGGVVGVVLFAAGAGFLLGVALRGVAHLRVDWRGLAEGGGLGVRGELVVGVVGPGAGLVGARGAVAEGVVAVLLAGQAQRLQGVVGGGGGEAVELVVGVAGFAQFALDVGDVAGRVVLVEALGEEDGGLVLHFDSGGPLQGVVLQGLTA